MTRATSGPEPEESPADWEALARYYAGESTASEAEAVEAWLHEDETRPTEFNALSGILSRITPLPDEAQVDSAWERLRERVHEPEVRSLNLRRVARERQSAPARRWAAPLMQIAAGIAIIASALLLFRLLVDTGDTGIALGRQFAAATGERQSLVLEDGTRVILGPRSRLTMAPGFGESHRTVDLTGEAMFEVDADPALIFAVRVPGALVEDLGTAFTVRADGTNAVRVVVTEGLVRLSRAGEPAEAGVELRAADRAELTADGRLSVERGGLSADDLAWTRGELVFRDASLQEVARDLRRWYGMELRVTSGSLAARTLTTSFTDETPEQIARIVALALGADAQVRGDTVLLTSTEDSP